VQRSSGFEHFDASAIQAIRRASPLAPPPPEELFRAGGEYLEFTLPIRYRNPMFE
jgi:TonB family protein